MTSVRSLRKRGLLQVQNLRAGWGPEPMLREVCFEVQKGDRIALLGPNGAGKSTLFDSLMGRLGVTEGQVRFEGRDVTGMPLHRLACEGLAYVPQEPTAFLGLSVEENLRAALHSPARKTPVGDGELDGALRAWGLLSLREHQAAVLSGGERRRVEVARALLLRPRLLLLDEPFSGLDPSGRRALLRGLEQVDSRTAVVISDHAADDVLAFAERVLLLLDGGLAFDGPRHAFSPDLAVWSRYFGTTPDGVLGS